MTPTAFRTLKRCFLIVSIILLASGIYCVYLNGTVGTIFLSGDADDYATITLTPNEDIESFLEIVGTETSKNGTLLRIKSTKAGKGSYSIAFYGNNGGGIEFFEAAALESGVLFFDCIPQGSEVLAAAGIVFSVLLFLYFIVSFHSREKITPYSYTLASQGGAVLFCTFCIGTEVVLLIRCLAEGRPFTLEGILYQLLDTPKSFNRILFPLLIFVFIAMAASNLVLVRKEGKRIKNILGASICALLTLLTVAAIALQSYITVSPEGFFVQFGIQLFTDTMLCYIECMIISIVFYGFKAANYKPKSLFDFIIIPGCKFASDGHLYPLLKDRVERALRLSLEQETNSGIKATLVPSGGKGSDEPFAEAEAMKKYLLEKGFPEDRILVEDRSMNTYQNMKYSRELIEAECQSPRVAFATTNYHVLRTGIYAAEVGLKAIGVGSRTAWYYWPNAFARELVALFVNRKKQHAFAAFLIFVFSFITAVLLYIMLR